ncbi:unnamed protein product [Rotaria sp. Silwood1]|nr:unnamed protein product [Rotaria sp. Silwood1]
MEIMLAGLFFMARNESGSQLAIPEGVLMCVLIFVTIGVQRMMSSSFDTLTRYLPVDAEEFPLLEIPVSRKLELAKMAIHALNPPRTSSDIGTVSHISDAVNEPNDNTMENAYMHPVMRDPKPIIWIPQDNLGIAADEVQQTRASGLDISMSTDGARFNEKKNIEIDGAPPDYVRTAE